MKKKTQTILFVLCLFVFIALRVISISKKSEHFQEGTSLKTKEEVSLLEKRD